MSALVPKNEEEARAFLADLLTALAAAREQEQAHRRQAAGLALVIDGMVDLFPTARSVLPDDWTPAPPPRRKRRRGPPPD